MPRPELLGEPEETPGVAQPTQPGCSARFRSVPSWMQGTGDSRQVGLEPHRSLGGVPERPAGQAADPAALGPGPGGALAARLRCKTRASALRIPAQRSALCAAPERISREPRAIRLSALFCTMLAGRRGQPPGKSDQAGNLGSYAKLKNLCQPGFQKSQSRTTGSHLTKFRMVDVPCRLASHG